MSLTATVSASESTSSVDQWRSSCETDRHWRPGASLVGTLRMPGVPSALVYDVERSTVLRRNLARSKGETPGELVNATLSRVSDASRSDSTHVLTVAAMTANACVLARGPFHRSAWRCWR